MGRLFRYGTDYVRAHVFNLLCAVVLATVALTPSLVPRPTVFQGFLAGLWFMLGFRLGSHVRGVWDIAVLRFGNTSTSGHPTAVPAVSRPSPGLWAAVGLAFLAYVIGYGALVVSGQNHVRRLVEMDPVDGAAHAGFLLSMIVTMMLCFGVARGLKSVRQMVARRVADRGGSARTIRWASRGTGLVATVALIAVLTGAALGAVGTIYRDRDAGTLDGSVQPTVASRSGSIHSVLDWDGLGRQGRAFASGGPGADAITRVTGAPAIEPIRVYAGRSQGTDTASRADLVVSELERSGAFDRDVLLVATPTGSGWLEPQALAALEYLHGGNTATASMQYFYQPSWVSFLPAQLGVLPFRP